jgi:parvulin-like peptidyl-prolyl isomerase
MALCVNGQFIGQELIDAEVALLTQQLSAVEGQTPESIAKLAREWAVDNAIERTLLAQASQSLETVTAQVPPPTRAEVVDFYNTHRARFRSLKSFHASHIVKNVDEQHLESNALSAVEAAQAELSRGVAFEAVADTFSDCPGSGGELGWFHNGEMVEEFEAVVSKLKPGQVSPIFRSPFGFHIAKLHARRPEGTIPLSEVFTKIESELLEEKRQAAINQLLDRLRAAASIEL